MTLILRNNALLVRGNSLATSTQCCCQPTPCGCPANVITSGSVDGLTITQGQSNKQKKVPFEVCAYGTPPWPANSQFFCGYTIQLSMFTPVNPSGIGGALTASISASQVWLAQTGPCRFGYRGESYASALVEISFCPSSIAQFFTRTSFSANWQVFGGFSGIASDTSVNYFSETYSTPSTQCQPPNDVAQLPMSITVARPDYFNNGSTDTGNLGCGNLQAGPITGQLAELVANLIAGITYTVSPGPP